MSQSRIENVVQVVARRVIGLGSDQIKFPFELLNRVGHVIASTLISWARSGRQ